MKNRALPFVFSNLATSLDGKINIAGKGHFPLGTRADWEEMQRLRKTANAIVFGASTLRGFRAACCVEDPHWARAKQPLNVVVSSQLNGLSPRWKFFTDPRIDRLLIVDEKTPISRIKRFEKSCDIHLVKSKSARLPLAQQIVEELQKRGVQRILVEGGGQVMWEFLRARLLDEVNITLTPRILGGSQAPTLVEGRGFGPKEVKNFELTRVKRIKNELYLTYRRQKQEGVQPAW
jgi:5-amino-6-(5-phosphoribosylamino)uracil reductase